MKYRFTFAAALLVMGACDGSTGPAGTANVAIRFGTSAPSSGFLADVELTTSPGALSDLTVTGTNGTLVIQDIRFIVSRLKLRRTEVTECADSSEDNDFRGDGDLRFDDRGGGGSGNSGRNGSDNNERESDNDCDEFEGGPFLVDLPLTGTTTTSIATDNVPAGTYTALSFRIRGLDDDNDDDSAERATVPAILAQMRTFYPNFPSNASMVVKGTFNGTPFTTYFRSKLEINQRLTTPLTVPGDKSVEVTIDPSAWFKNGNQILDLTALNGQTVNLGSNFKNGMKGVNRRHDD